MRILATLSILAVLPILNPARAQSTAPTHQHTPEKMIDGAANPELIPDLTAYRLYLVMVSQPASPKDEQNKRQEAQLRKIGLQEADEKALFAALENFNYEYRNLIEGYNRQATAAWARGQKLDIGSLRLQRDQVVQSTHDALKAALTPAGWARLGAC